MRLEGCLPLIAFTDVYIVVPPSDVKFFEQYSSFEVLISGNGYMPRIV